MAHSARSFPTPASWSPDGRLLAFVLRPPTTQEDIWVIDLADPARPMRPVIQTPASESFPAFSPDGKWLVYASNESGRGEIYAQPYPGPGPRVQISTQGGSAPAWTSNGTEIVYVGAGSSQRLSQMWAVSVKATAAGLVADTPRRLFEGLFTFTGPVNGYDVTPDGQRFLMVQPRDPPPVPPVQLVMVENWFEELRRSVK